MTYIKLDTESKLGDFIFSADIEINCRITGIFGPSGAGKTTLLHQLSGIQNPDKGLINLNNRLLFDSAGRKHTRVHKRKIGYVFQEGRLFPHLSVRKNLLFGYSKKHSRSGLFGEIVDLLELQSLIDQMPSQLSGGQKQRVAIGRALLSNAELLLLDEPFSSLDSNLKKQIIRFLSRIIDNLEIPLIIVSHSLRDLLMLTDQILLIKEGKAENPDSYLNLIKSGKLLDFDGMLSNYYNVLQGSVSETDHKKGITKVEFPQIDRYKLNIESDTIKHHPGDTVKIILRGADITLALKRVEDISIRNQIPGKISFLKPYRNHMICIVDCGLPIIVRLTNDAYQTLKLEEGKVVWCLFKSLAIETF